MFIYAFLLFFVLTPGILVCLPPKSSKTVVALTHAVIFALVWTFTNKMVWRATSGMFESMSSYPNINICGSDISTGAICFMKPNCPQCTSSGMYHN
jgi:hypothetical protein